LLPVLGDELGAVHLSVTVECLLKLAGSSRNDVDEPVPAQKSEVVRDLDQTGDRVPEGVPVHAVEVWKAKLLLQQDMQTALINDPADINGDHGDMLSSPG